jgi:hypothetical protein
MEFYSGTFVGYLVVTTESFKEGEVNQMKFKIVSMAFIAIFSISVTTAMAADSPKLRTEAADRYLKVVPMEEMLNNTFSALAKKEPPEQREKFIAQMHSLVRVKKLERISRDAMVKVFTADELNALANFYGSKEGKSAMKKFGDYMALVMPAVRQEVRRAMMEIQAEKKH